LNINTVDNTYTIGKWNENMLEGLALLSADNKEKLIIFSKNKIKKLIDDLQEIEKIKISQDFKNLEEFYQRVTLNIK
jgi:hypothetical protein